MITHPLTTHDLELIRILYNKYYNDEFPLPDLTVNCLTTFKIFNDQNEIVLAGGVKLNPELIVITEKDRSAQDRAFALISALQIATLVSKAAGHELLSATVINDEVWLKQLLSYGFRESIGKHLVIG